MKTPPPTKLANLWLETHTGRKFDVRNPMPESITIFDIAHHLSNQCRYTGATSTFYSVGQHSCLLAAYAETVLHATAFECLQTIMHDAPEAYLPGGDMARPIKNLMPDYRVMEAKIHCAISGWLAIDPSTPPPEFLERIDTGILTDERISLLPHGLSNEWATDDIAPRLGIVIKPWTPEWTRQQFLARYAAYSFAVYGAHQYLDERYGAVPRLQAATDDSAIADLTEVDFRGKCGKIKLRTDDGMLVRDPSAMPIPMPKWAYMHGTFTLIEGAKDRVRKTS